MGSFKSNNLPDSFLRCIPKDQRSQSGIKTLTQSEAKEKNNLALEKELQREIEQDLNRRGIVCIHSKFGVKPTIASSLPDFMFCILISGKKIPGCVGVWEKTGFPIAIECKLPGEHLTKEQGNIMCEMCNNGWTYKIVYTFEEYSQWLNSLLL
jgi:hypothetical protein